MKIDLNPLWCQFGHFNIDQSEFVSNLVESNKPEYCLETGFCTGRSALSVLLSTDVKKFMTIDIDFGYDETGDGTNGYKYKKLFQEHFSSFNAIEGSSRDILTEDFLKSEFPSGIDWVTVDGDHTYQGCQNDILSVMPFMNTGGTILVDDYKSGPPNGHPFPAINNACDDAIKLHNLNKTEWNSKGKGFCIIQF